MSKFQSLLAEGPSVMAKEAIESPDNIQFEQDFAKLAYMFLKDRAAGLVPHLLGFEIVERSDDGAKAIGIFGFKIGEDYYYVPSFFVNNQIKGMDLLYSKKTNMFVPLRDKWIDYIVNRQTITLGEGTKESGPGLYQQFEMPRFDFIAEPPAYVGGVGTKYSSAIDFRKNAIAVWNEMQNKLVEMLDKDAEFQKALGGAVCRMTHKPLPFEKSASDSAIIKFLTKSGGKPVVDLLFNTIVGNPEYAKAAMAFYPDTQSLYVEKFANELFDEPKRKLEIVTEVTDWVDGEARRKLVRDGFAIRDSRGANELSESYDTDYEKRFTSPQEPGVYHILLRHGGTMKAWVFNQVNGEEQIVVDPTSRSYFRAEPGALFARDSVAEVHGDQLADFREAYDKAKSVDALEIGKEYILINERGTATPPFEVEAIVSEEGQRTLIKIWQRSGTVYKRPMTHDWDRLRTGPARDCIKSHDTRYLQLADHRGKLARQNDDTLIVPNNFKILEVGEKKDKNKAETSPMGYGSQTVVDELMRPGSLTDLMEAINKQAMHKLAVGTDDGIEYQIALDGVNDGRPVNAKSAQLSLIVRYGLPVKEAEEIMNQAQTEYKSRRLIKFAQQLVGVGMPQYNPIQYGVDSYSGILTQAPQIEQQRGQMLGVPPLQDPTRYGFNLGGQSEMDLNAAGVATQAGAAGQKNVFDHATIGGLAKLYDIGSVIDSYVPELMTSLDRLGRIIFMFYWKNEEFAERYGSEDMSDMEDLLRAVFRSFGDLVMELRKKTIDSESVESTMV